MTNESEAKTWPEKDAKILDVLMGDDEQRVKKSKIENIASGPSARESDGD